MIDDYITTTLHTLLSKIGVSYSDIENVPGSLGTYRKFNIITDETSFLIGKEGATLQAFNYVVRKIVEPKIIESDPSYRFYVDVGNYEESRIERVRQTARTFAERAKMFERDVELPPMDSYDRMIVHTTLEEYDNLTTVSEGENTFRKVIIKYAPKNTSSGGI